MTFSDYATVALHFGAKVEVLLSKIEHLLVAHKEFLSQLHYLLTRHGDLILHVRDEQILVQLVNVRDGLEVVSIFVDRRDSLRLTVTLSSALLLLL